MSGDEGGLSPEEAFWLLGDETRVAILRAVWAADGETVSFTDLRERVGSPDSGQFNYHLDKLRGHFLANPEGGYRLTQAGREVVRAVLAGTITERPEMDPAAIDADCPDCGGRLIARYDEYGVVECAECGSVLMWNEFPPAGLDGRTAAEAAAALDRWTRHRFRLATAGVCPNCAGRMTRTRVEDESGATGGLATHHRCRNCRYEARVPLVGHVLDHPAVVAFYHEAGVDVTGLPYWEQRALAREFETAVASEEPWRAEVALTAGGRTLLVTLDGNLDVVGVERTGR